MVDKTHEGTRQLNASVLTRERLRTLSVEAGKSMRKVLDSIVEEYYKRHHKPWLGRKDADDIKLLNEALNEP